MSKGKRFYTVPEFADLAGVSTQTIYQQLKRGRLKTYGHKINGVRKINAEALAFYRPDPEPEQEEQEQPQPGETPEAVALLRDQIRFLTETLEHEREMHKQTQEALRQTQELMKAQAVQITMLAKQTQEEADPVGDKAPGGSDQEDPVPSGSDRTDPEPQAGTAPEPKQEPQAQSQPDPENQRTERRGFFSKLFGR